MQMMVCGTNLTVTPSLEQHIERSVEQALDRFDNRIQEIHITLTDIAGRHHRRAEMKCQLKTKLRHAEDIIIEQTDHDLYAAVDRAVNRMKRMVRRRIDKRRSQAQRMQQAHPYTMAA